MNIILKWEFKQSKNFVSFVHKCKENFSVYFYKVSALYSLVKTPARYVVL